MEFHIECEAADIARYVFTPGSHSRTKKIASEGSSPAIFGDARLVCDRAMAIWCTPARATETKPAWGEEAFRKGEENAIRIGIEAMKMVALADGGCAEC